MQLTVGKKTNAELAEWFGISLKSFTNRKKEKLEELKYFAEYYQDKGKIVITSVLNPVYTKKASNNYMKVLNKVDEVWSKDGLDTCSRVGDEIYEILTEEDKDFNLKNSTVRNYTLRSRNELYGKPFMGGGKVGDCVYLWCKRDPETGLYAMLNEEERRIKQDLQVKYFGDATEKGILVKGMIEAGEITKEEAWEVFEEMSGMGTGNFMGFLKELQNKLGCQVVKGTLVQRSSAAIESVF